MLNASVVKTVTALLVTATMAIPAPLWAKNSDEGTTGATDGLPVIFEPVNLQDGRTEYLAIAPVPADQENQAVKTLAKNGKNLTLAVAGPDDPALAAAFESGYLPWIQSFIVGSADQSPLINAAKPSLKQKIKDKIKQITALCLKEKMGLIVAASVATISSSYVMYVTASVPDGMKALVGLFAWSAFQSMNSAGWDWYLDKGGEKLTEFMGWAFVRYVSGR